MKFIGHISILVLCFLFLFALQSCGIDFNGHTIENWHKLRATGEAALVKQDYQAAQKSFEETLKLCESLHEPARQAVSLEDLSRVCLETNDLPLAANICDQALTLASKRSQVAKVQIDILQSSLGQCFNNLARVFIKAKKYDQAAIAYREARALFADVYKNSPPILSNFIAASYLAWAIDGLGTSYKELGQLKEARKAYFSVTEYNIIKGLNTEIKARLLANFCKIPDTSKGDKEQYAKILGCPLQ